MNDNASPVQESIVDCTGKPSKCTCDTCGASRREKGRLQKQKSTSTNDDKTSVYFKVNNMII